MVFVGAGTHFMEDLSGQICDQLYVLTHASATVDVSTRSNLMTVSTTYLYRAAMNIQGTHTHV